jgi:alcohol-forming fatty acyl-CoA reductase
MLQDAIEINLLGTKKIVNLVLGLEKLKSFVHVSTLYSNCNRKEEIDEKIYDHTLSYHQLIPVAKILKNMKVKEREEMEKLLFQNLPNTYTLTKHFSEKLVYHQAFFMPAGIFRPPIVRYVQNISSFFMNFVCFQIISSYKDFAGYTDNLNGPSGIVAWCCRGFIHCIYGDAKLRSNLVPVDYCINALIATAWDVHEK